MEKVEPITLDRVLHDSVRTRIMQILYASHAITFNDLRRILKDINEGTISRQLYRLQEEGYVKIKKGFLQRKPNTQYLLTEKGENAFKEYMKKLKKLVENMAV